MLGRPNNSKRMDGIQKRENLMKLHAKTVIACKVVIFLKSGERLCAQKIAAETGYSLKYLEITLAELSKAGIIKGKKGCKGGYILLKENITLLDIIDATEGFDFPIGINEAIKGLFGAYDASDVI